MLGIVLGLAAYVLFGVAMALMKYGADTLARPRDIRSDPAVRRRFAVWVLGSVVNFAYVALLAVALGFGRASVLGAMNGFGLVVLAVLSHAFLDERVGALELGGIALVVLGTGLLGATAAAPDAVAPAAAGGAVPLAWFGASLCATTAVLIAVSLLRQLRGAAATFAVAAGATGGLGILCQKVFVTRLFDGMAWTGLATDAAFLSFAVVSTLAFVFIQVAYQYGRAVVVVPIFSATTILVPVVGGVVVFLEPAALAMVAGVMLVLAGVVLLTAFSGRAEVPGEAFDRPGTV